MAASLRATASDVQQYYDVLDLPMDQSTKSSRVIGATVSVPGISVIVPVHDGTAHLERCLQGISQSLFDNFELIVVDDGSQDASAEIARVYADTVVRLIRRTGPSRARNIGAMYARGKILLFVDSDVVIPPTALKRILARFEADSKLGALFGSYDDAPDSPDFVSQFKNLFHHYIHQTARPMSSSFWAGCGAIRKTVFEALSGFDAAAYQKASVEDMELGARMARDGHRVLLDHGLQAKHLKHWTLRSMVWADVAYRALPWTKHILKTRDMPRDLNLKYAARFSVALVLLLVALLTGLFLSFGGLFPTSTGQFCGTAIILSVLSLCALNWKVYRFFQRKRGLWFALCAILMHWFYYFYSGLVFAGCTVHYWLSAFSSAAMKAAVQSSEVHVNDCAPRSSVIEVPSLGETHGAAQNQGAPPAVRCVEINTP